VNLSAVYFGGTILVWCVLKKTIKASRRFFGHARSIEKGPRIVLARTMNSTVRTNQCVIK
jgi:transcription termination factor Rho